MSKRSEVPAKIKNYVSYALGEYYVSFPPVFEVLNKIPQMDRKVLAIWAYKRFEEKKDIKAYWTWDSDQIAAYNASETKDIVESAVKGVATEFKSILSGHKLYGAADPRPLSEQAYYWRTRDSVGGYATSLNDKLLYELQKERYTDDYDGYLEFVHLLAVRWASGVLVEPKTAVPGLSPHGQMRAIDFHVFRDGVKVATSGGADHWISSGFDAALKKAVKAYNNKKGREVFDGPLKSPKEPWHYNYIAA